MTARFKKWIGLKRYAKDYTDLTCNARTRNLQPGDLALLQQRHRNKYSSTYGPEFMQDSSGNYIRQSVPPRLQATCRTTTWLPSRGRRGNHQSNTWTNDCRKTSLWTISKPQHSWTTSRPRQCTFSCNTNPETTRHPAASISKEQKTPKIFKGLFQKIMDFHKLIMEFKFTTLWMDIRKWTKFRDWNRWNIRWMLHHILNFIYTILSLIFLARYRTRLKKGRKTVSKYKLISD